MTVWLVNPPKKKKAAKRRAKRATSAGSMASVKKEGRSVSRAAWQASGYTRNAPKRKRAAKRKPPKGFKSWASYMAHIRGFKKNSASKGKTTMAARKKTRRRKSAAPRKTTRRRRSYRRNPPIAKQLQQTAVNALGVTAGRIATKVAASRLPGVRTLTGPLGLAAQAGIALGVGLIADKVAPRGLGAFIAAGALNAAIEEALVMFDVPVVSDALAAYPQLAAYPVDGQDLSALPVDFNTSPAQLGAGYSGANSEYVEDGFDYALSIPA